jgi:hypothetical protein
MTITSRRNSSDDILDRADLRAQDAATADRDSGAGQIFDPLARGSSDAFDGGRSAYYPSYLGSFGSDD